jgi:hypothetical protein
MALIKKDFRLTRRDCEYLSKQENASALIRELIKKAREEGW